MFIANAGAAGVPVGLELILDAEKEIERNDAFVFAFVRFVLVTDLADVGDVGQ